MRRNAVVPQCAVLCLVHRIDRQIALVRRKSHSVEGRACRPLLTQAVYSVLSDLAGVDFVVLLSLPVSDFLDFDVSFSVLAGLEDFLA